MYDENISRNRKNAVLNLIKLNIFMKETSSCRSESDQIPDIWSSIGALRIRIQSNPDLDTGYGAESASWKSQICNTVITPNYIFKSVYNVN